MLAANVVGTAGGGCAAERRLEDKGSAIDSGRLAMKDVPLLLTLVLLTCVLGIAQDMPKAEVFLDHT